MIRFLADHVGTGENGALEAPTGSGKSLVPSPKVAYTNWKGTALNPSSPRTPTSCSPRWRKGLPTYSGRPCRKGLNYETKSVMGRGRYVCRKRKKTSKVLMNRKGPIVISGEDRSVVLILCFWLPYSMDATDGMAGEESGSAPPS